MTAMELNSGDFRQERSAAFVTKVYLNIGDNRNSFTLGDSISAS